MVNQVHAIKTALTEWFAAREAREKKLLIAVGAVAAAALVYDVLWAPAWEGRNRITAGLPQIEAQLADVQTQADEARRLKAVSAVGVPAGAALRDALAASLAKAGIAQPQLASLGKGVQVDAKDVSFNAWFTWLDYVCRTYRLRVVDAHATAEARRGQATVSAVLQPATESP